MKHDRMNLFDNATTIVAVCALMVTFAGHTDAAEEPWQRHVIDPGTHVMRGADGVRLADVNGDRLPDIVTPWEQGNAVRLYVNPGPQRARQEWPAVTVGKVASGEDAVSVDLDGDGALDVVTSCEGRTRTVFVHWAPKDKTRQLDATAWQTRAISVTQNEQMWMFALPMQIDGRGGIDLIVGSKGGSGAVSWLQSPEDPRDLGVWKMHTLCPAGWIMSLVAHDVDADGDADVVVSDRFGKRRGTFWLENPGTETAAQGGPWKSHPIGAQGLEVMFVGLIDLDGDRQTDVLTTTRNGKIIFSRRLGEGVDVRWENHSIKLPLGMPYGKSIAVGDIDGDGRQDIVTTNRGTSKGSSVAWMRYDRSPTEEEWQAHDISGPAGSKFDLVELLDLDADGDLDVLTCEESENLGVFWYENPRIAPSSR